MSMNTVHNVTNAVGICLVLDNSQSADTIKLEVMDDIEGEQETCGELLDDKDNGDVGTAADTKEVLANIQAASKGVKEGTAVAYNSVMVQFNTFLAKEVIPPGTDIFTEQILHPKLTTTLLASLCKAATVLTCMICCVLIYAGLEKAQGCKRRNPNEVISGGSVIIIMLLKIGMLVPPHWCGGNMQKFLQAVYLIMFTCLLQIDEALKIQVHDIEFGIDDVNSTHSVSITLPFCKSNPFDDQTYLHLYYVLCLSI
ncbi:hypothetical protein IW261DRAFT_1422195 [Armillaria novae-zelandiae]|uniref:Uncharacterized protein n=1 Tax=Armillaria novae-zelandiae TaxID=153914 RepID=A0AA39P1Q0_9AGAR|nr:hypothetical protein IW261DRAFT_1422195 [Armillaria novae-zelandiae]